MDRTSMINVLEKFTKTEPADIAGTELPEKLELGIDISAAALNIACDYGACKLVSAITKPVIDAETRIPVKILYHLGSIGITGMVSIGVRNYVGSIFTTVKTGIKAVKVIKDLKKEAENGSDSEQVCEA